MKYFLLFIVLFAVVFIPVTFAQEASPSAAHNDYTLPYPGLLPDNPLYPLKMLRDRIAAFLIKDIRKSAEFSLLQGEKRVHGGYYLFLKRAKEEDRALSTIEKGYKYIATAIQQTRDAKQQGMEVGYLWDQLERSLAKQETLLLDMKKRSEHSKKIDQIEKKRRQLLKDVTTFSQKKEEKK